MDADQRLRELYQRYTLIADGLVAAGPGTELADLLPAYFDEAAQIMTGDH
jgi:hypothetical protein